MARRKERTDQAAAPESLSYEEAIAELESIIDRIERGDIGLEESLRQFERGDALVRRCDAVLRSAEQKVEQLDRVRIAELQRGAEASVPNGDAGSDADMGDADDEEEDGP